MKQMQPDVTYIPTLPVPLGFACLWLEVFFFFFFSALKSTIVQSFVTLTTNVLLLHTFRGR